MSVVLLRNGVNGPMIRSTTNRKRKRERDVIFGAHDERRKKHPHLRYHIVCLVELNTLV